MVTRLLPDGPELPLQEDTLANLVQRALVAAARDLQHVVPAMTIRTVYRPIPNGWGGCALPCPSYRSREVWDGIAEVWNSRECAALTEYVWANGALKKQITIDGDAVPDKPGWARFIWGELVHGPLLELLENVLIVDLTMTGGFTLWRLDENAVLLASREVARRVCRTGRHVLVTCPIIGLHMEGDLDRFDLEPGITLRRLTEDRKRLLLSQFGEEFVNEDLSSWGSHALFEMNTVMPWVEDDEIGSFAARALDRLKWATMIVFQASSPLEEGPVILRGAAGWRGRTLRRGVVLSSGRTSAYFPVTPDVLGRLKSLSEAFTKAEASTPELTQALWHLGRACNAALARDVLLDATIGLELLLVPDPGESTYKLSVHGLAILGSSVGNAVTGELVNIYRLRSEAAHGSPSIEEKFRKLAPRARQLLAKAIGAVVERINNGSLDVSSTRGDVGKAVKAFVLKTIGEAVQNAVAADGAAPRR